jgi:hypothetical protein
MEPSVITLPQTLFTMPDLASFGGLVMAVYIIVSFFKEPLKTWLGDWIVRPFSVVIALIIMLWIVFVQGSATPETIGLSIINAFLVALVAGAAHDYIVNPVKENAAKKQIAAEQVQLDIMGIQSLEKNTAAQNAASIKTGDRGSDEDPDPANIAP